MRRSLSLTVVALLLVSPAHAQRPKEDPKERLLKNRTRLLRRSPKHFAMLRAVRAEPREIEVKLEKSGEVRKLRLEPDAEVRVSGWWGRLEHLRVGNRVWVWLRLDRNDRPASVLMIADEISEQVLHGLPWALVSVDDQRKRLVVKRKRDGERTLGFDAHDEDEVPVGTRLWFQSRGGHVSRVWKRDALVELQKRQRIRMHRVWKARGLPGTAAWVHPLTGQAQLMIDHEGMRWARGLKAGDWVSFASPDLGRALVTEVTPWNERTRVTIAARGRDLTALPIGTRVRLAVEAPPPEEAVNDPLPPDCDRKRDRATRIDWFLASTYCTCSIAGDGCTGMYYTLASCNPKTCGMPNRMRKEFGKLIDDGLTDRQILERLVAEHGAHALHPHILR